MHIKSTHSKDDFGFNEVRETISEPQSPPKDSLRVSKDSHDYRSELADEVHEEDDIKSKLSIGYNGKRDKNSSSSNNSFKFSQQDKDGSMKALS